VWRAEEPVVVDLPMHVDPIAIEARRDMVEQDVTRHVELEDTLGVITVMSAWWLRARTLARVMARDGENTLHGFMRASCGSVLYRVSAPGAPGRPDHPFLILRASEPSRGGWVRVVWT